MVLEDMKDYLFPRSLFLFWATALLLFPKCGHSLGSDLI